MTRWTALFFLASAVALSGCGGGGGGDTAAIEAPPAATPVQTTRLAANQAVESSFTQTTPRMVAIDPGTSDSSHVQAYEITMTTAGTLTVLMQSNSLDSYLQLFDASFLDDPTDDTAFIAESDDVGTTLHAMISKDLPAGTYVVLASSAYGNVADTGPYALMSMVTR